MTDYLLSVGSIDGNLDNTDDFWSINDYFSGVVIIPAKKAPFLIFKDFGAPCFLRNSDGSIDYDYFLFWKGKNYGHEIPKGLSESLCAKIQGIISSEYPTWINLAYDSYPQGVVELPISYLINQDKIQLLSQTYVTPVKKALRKLGFFREMRGRNKSRKKIKDIRDKFIWGLYIKLGKLTRIPQKQIQDAWADKVNNDLCPNNTKEASVYLCSDSTIRRLIKQKIKAS